MSELRVEAVEVGKRLRAARLVAGLSQRRLAELASEHLPDWRGDSLTHSGRRGTSYAYISRIESGDRMPSVHALRALGEVLGVSAHWLETGRELVEWQVELVDPALPSLTLRLDTADPATIEQVEQAALAHGVRLQRTDTFAERVESFGKAEP